MKKFLLYSVLAMIGIIALGFFLSYINKVSDCKEYLVTIGRSYVLYCTYKERYLSESDKESEMAQEYRDTANEMAGMTLYWIRFMEDNNDPDLIRKCIPKLSITEMQNLQNAFDYYESRIDDVYEAYGTPTPHK